MAATGRIHPADNIPRAAFGAYAAAVGGGGRFQGRSPAAVIKSLWPSDRVSPRLVERGAVQPATTSDELWAGVLAQEATGAFFGALGPASAASRLIAAGATVPLGRRASLRIPRRAGLPDALPWIGERDPIPVKQYGFDEATLGPAAKFASISVMTAELAKASGAEEIFAALLREDAAASLDLAVFSDGWRRKRSSEAPTLAGLAACDGHTIRCIDLSTVLGYWLFCTASKIGKQLGSSLGRETGKSQAVPDRFARGYLDQLDGRTTVAIEMRERFRAFTDDLGGAEALSYAQRALVERALWLEYWLQHQERTLADGGDFDAAKWVQGCNSLQGVLARLGLERKAKDVADLGSYLASRAPATDAGEAASVAAALALAPN